MSDALANDSGAIKQITFNYFWFAVLNLSINSNDEEISKDLIIVMWHPL